MQIAIVGGGPAGLRAAEVAALGGAAVTLFDARASVGRKFLVAGRGGLNLTKDEPIDLFASRYGGPSQPPDFWRALIGQMDVAALRTWASELGSATFVASTGRVYPKALKAAPLLRHWVQRLRSLGVKFAMRHRWAGLESGGSLRLHFAAPGTRESVDVDAAVLALGGASWPGTGSDGGWVETLRTLGVEVAPLQPANCGWEVPWRPEVLAAAEGHPLKSIAASAGSTVVKGELLVTRYGLEGGAIYQLGPELRMMPAPVLTIDFKPGVTADALVSKMGPVRRNFLLEARVRWKLSDPAFAIISTADPAAFATAESLAGLVKAFDLPLRGPRPIAEAISSAGGVCWSELTGDLMLHRLPGVFVAGEMIDWEAPTGGYLIHGCLAMGAHAARSAVAFCSGR